MALHSRDIAPTDPTLRRAKDIEVLHRDRAWHSWYLLEDGALHVFGAYGERKEPLGGKRSTRVIEARARTLLLEIVKAFSFNPVPEVHQARPKRRR